MLGWRRRLGRLRMRTLGESSRRFTLRVARRARFSWCPRWRSEAKDQDDHASSDRSNARSCETRARHRARSCAVRVRGKRGLVIRRCLGTTSQCFTDADCAAGQVCIDRPREPGADESARVSSSRCPSQLAKRCLGGHSDVVRPTSRPPTCSSGSLAYGEEQRPNQAVERRSEDGPLGPGE
jgi:Cys-rich repeat protein